MNNKNQVGAGRRRWAEIVQAISHPWKRSGVIVLIAGVPGFAHSAQAQATDAQTRQASWAQHVQLKQESLFKELAWRAVGPTFCGGRIQSIAVHPARPYTIYVGVGSGNLWKSENNGVTWKPIFDQESTFTIGEVAIAPSNPDVVWVGSGEVLMARSSYAGTGVFKSTNSGETWTNMGLGDTHHIGRVLIDPQDPNIVYVAGIGHNFSTNAERGLFKTVDGGQTWSKVLYLNERVGVIDVEMDPTDRQTLYAAAWEHDRRPWGHVVAGPGSGLYKSSDGGKSWRKLTDGLPGGKDLGRIGVEIAPSSPKVLYVLLDNQSPRPGRPNAGRSRPQAIQGEVYRSDDCGEHWQKVNVGDLPTSIGYDWNLLRIAPDNENELYVGGNCFVTSQDGGRTYRPVGGTIVPLFYKEKRDFPLDHHALWIDPNHPDHIILGHDHGLFFSYDRAKSWLHMNNLPITEFYAIAVDLAKPYNIYGGNQDNAAVFGPSTSRIEPGAPNLWKYLYLDPWGGGDGFVTLPDPTDTNKVYYFSGRTVFLKNLADGTQINVTPEINSADGGLRYNWMVPFIISPHDPKTLYYGANKLLKSTDQGAHWEVISPDLSTQPGPDKRGNVPYGTLTTLAESPLQSGLIYGGTDDGHVQVTQDGGKSWTLINQGLPNKWVSRVTASQYDAGTVYVSLTGYREDDFEKYLYRSKDYGKTWSPLSGNLPSEPVNVIKEDPQKPQILYVGTDLGAYVTLDGGKSWHSLCNQLPTAAVYDLVVHPRDHELVIGTHGRSIFVLDVKSIQSRVP